jgi:hypothetical protein
MWNVVIFCAQIYGKGEGMGKKKKKNPSQQYLKHGETRLRVAEINIKT